MPATERASAFLIFPVEKLAYIIFSAFLPAFPTFLAHFACFFAKIWVENSSKSWLKTCQSLGFELY